MSELRSALDLKKCLNIAVLRRFEGIVDLNSLMRLRAARTLNRYLVSNSREKQSIETLAPLDLLFRTNGSPVDAVVRLLSARVAQPGFSQMSASVVQYFQL